MSSGEAAVLITLERINVKSCETAHRSMSNGIGAWRAVHFARERSVARRTREGCRQQIAWSARTCGFNQEYKAVIAQGCRGTVVRRRCRPEAEVGDREKEAFKSPILELLDAGLDITCICMYGTGMKLRSLPCYCATLRQAARAVTVLYEDLLADSGLHATQFTALQLLNSAPNLTTTELADALGVDQTTATRTLALIKKAGLASDTVGLDRRERRWTVSAQGQALLKKLKPRWEAAQKAFERRLGRAEATALKKASYLAASRLSSS